MSTLGGARRRDRKWRWGLEKLKSPIGFVFTRGRKNAEGAEEVDPVRHRVMWGRGNHVGKTRRALASFVSEASKQKRSSAASIEREAGDGTRTCKGLDQKHNPEGSPERGERVHVRHQNNRQRNDREKSSKAA